MHFLNKNEIYRAATIDLRRACVTVRHDNGLLFVQGDIGVTKTDAIFVELPDRISVVGGDGKKIRATGKFLVSTETFDPFHLVVDMF